MERKIVFSNEETYHVYNRGINKMDIFLVEEDYMRFAVLMLLCNSTASVDMRAIIEQYGPLHKGRSFVEILENEASEDDERLVDILAYSLMPNHFHFVLRQRKEGGITLFMSKLVTGYAMYFNKKYDRVGPLLSGRFQAKHIDSDQYLTHIFSYVHLNPLDLFHPSCADDLEKKRNIFIDFLREYKWSSFVDYYVTERVETNLIFKDIIDESSNPRDIFDFYNYT